MIRALVLRLEGPMQSWGGPVAGNDRPSLDVPTKSGVLGLVAGALGIERAAVAELAALHAGYAFAVRADRRGSVGVDYHTTAEVPTADGDTREDIVVISKRRYIYDGAFTALLVPRSSPPRALEEIARALGRPTFAPFLGRRACPPSVPVVARDARPIEGVDWRALFDEAPLAGRADRGPFDVHLDAELAPDLSHRARRQRDVLLGRLRRLFDERTVHVARWSPQKASRAPEETIDPWMP